MKVIDFAAAREGHLRGESASPRMVLARQLRELADLAEKTPAIDTIQWGAVLLFGEDTVSRAMVGVTEVSRAQYLGALTLEMHRTVNEAK